MNLDADSALINQVENILFGQHFPTATERKKAARFAFATCLDENLKSLLGNAVGYHTKNPDYSRSYISRARGHIQALREAQKE